MEAVTTGSESGNPKVGGPVPDIAPPDPDYPIQRRSTRGGVSGKKSKGCGEPYSSDPHERFRRLLEQSGAVAVPSGKHIKYVLPSGKKLVVSRTPSDYRAVFRQIGDLKRLMEKS